MLTIICKSASYVLTISYEAQHINKTFIKSLAMLCSYRFLTHDHFFSLVSIVHMYCNGIATKAIRSICNVPPT